MASINIYMATGYHRDYPLLIGTQPQVW